MNDLFNTVLPLDKPQEPQKAYKSKFKIVVKGAGAGASFTREFATIKAMNQYIRRNPGLSAVTYTMHDGKWERFVVYGSSVISESILRSLLNSISLPPVKT